MTNTLVMAVPWDQMRVRRAVELARSTGAEVVWDSTRNAFDTWRTVLLTAGEDSVIILEDDVQLAQNWRVQVEETIDAHRNDIIQFFSLRNEKESGYRAAGSFLMNQCYYLPEGVADKLYDFSVDWVERHPEHPTGYDICMSTWMKETGRKYWMRVPSLVQHEKWVSEINSRRPRNRQSKSFEVI